MRPLLPAPTAAALGLCLALGPTLAGFFIYKGILSFKAADNYITVKGLVERIEKSDRGDFNIGYKITGNDLPELYKKLALTKKGIQDFFRQEGFPENDISSQPPLFQDLHGQIVYGQGAVLPPERYSIEGSVSVKSQDVDKLETLSEKMADLMSQGLPLTKGYASFYLDRFNALRQELIVEATKNAQQMAESIAKTTGQKLGGTRKVNQGVISILYPHTIGDETNSSRGASDSLMKKIRVLATLEFYSEK